MRAELDQVARLHPQRGRWVLGLGLDKLLAFRIVKQQPDILFRPPHPLPEKLRTFSLRTIDPTLGRPTLRAPSILVVRHRLAGAVVAKVDLREGEEEVPLEIWVTNVDHEKDAAGRPNGAIERVCAWLYDPTRNVLHNKQSYTRARVIELIRDYNLPQRQWTNALYTATKNAQGNYVKGAKIEVTRDGKYITTEGNATTRDNLGNLPPCDC